MRKGISLAAILALATAGALGVCAPTPPQPTQSPVGATAPNFTLPSQEDKPVSLSDYKGKWVVLYFYPKDHDHRLHHRSPQLPAGPSQVRRASTQSCSASRLDTVESHKTFCSQGHLSPSSCSLIPTTRSSMPTAFPSPHVAT